MYDWQDDRVIIRNGKPEVLLTFDDGPTEFLPELLSILKKENAQGLFFWQSSLLKEAVPWKRVLDEGHLIGSHAHSHPKLSNLSYEEQYKEMENSKRQLEKLVGREIHYFRPPYGLYNEDTMKIAEELNLKVVLWQVASWDWKHETGEHQIIENVREYTQAGDVILLHELPQTVKVLPEVIQALREKGLWLSAPHAKLQLAGKG
ncbi:MAG TPA: polysaccharide deacetylase family protein [Bacillales bacterium]|nr:polysaccharide deacetylase family protein [Bacillales bacterium]